MRKLLTALMLPFLLLNSSASQAAEPTPEVRRDAEGVKGISPYREQLAAGQRAFASRDLPAAITAFKQALQIDSNKMLAYILLAQTQLENGAFDVALTTLTEGRTKPGQADVQAKAIFLQAMMLERKANKDATKPADGLGSVLVTAWEASREAWSAYAVFLTAHSTLPDYKASAADRKNKIDARQKRDKIYGEVRARAAEKAKQRAQKK